MIMILMWQKHEVHGVRLLAVGLHTMRADSLRSGDEIDTCHINTKHTQKQKKDDLSIILLGGA